MLYKYIDENTIERCREKKRLSVVDGKLCTISEGKELVTTEKPPEKPFCKIVPKYVDGEHITNVWQYVERSSEETIALLKSQLAQDDYKIIKCAEYQLNQSPLPYDIAELHRERQAIRNQINILEKE